MNLRCYIIIVRQYKKQLYLGSLQGFVRIAGNQIGLVSFAGAAIIGSGRLEPLY